MHPLLLLLLVAAAPALAGEAPSAPGRELDAVAGPPTNEPAIVSTTPPVRLPPEHDALKATVLVVVGEGIAAGVSALAMRWPVQTGWTEVALAPLGIMNGQPGDTTAGLLTAMGGQMAIGLGNALLLRASRFSQRDRFLLNLAAWNVWAVGVTVVTRHTQPSPPAAPPPRPPAAGGAGVGVGLGMGPAGPALLVAGRF